MNGQHDRSDGLAVVPVSGQVLKQRLHMVALLGLAVSLVGPLQAQGEAVSTGEKPVSIVVGDDGIKTITLTEHAAARLGIATVRVVAGPGGLTIIPMAAGLYLPDGSTWTFVEVEHLSYRRELITISDITEEGILLLGGPKLGTSVVISGVPEFWGLESGIGG